MRESVCNSVHVEGYLYDCHKLEERVSGENSKRPGVPYIRGTIGIATDKECSNVVHITYLCVYPKFNSGAENPTYKILRDIIDKKIGLVTNDGIDNAGIVRADSSIGLSEFYDAQSNYENLISIQENQGGFLHLISEGELKENLLKRSEFDIDVILTGCYRKAADPEKEETERIQLKGYVFNYLKEMKPIELTVRHPGAMKYFLSLDISQKTPVFTRLKGTQISRTVVKKIEEQSPWGEISVRETSRSTKEYLVNWAQSSVYPWGTPSTMTNEEMSQKLSDREISLAEMKQNQIQRANEKKATPVSANDVNSIRGVPGVNFLPGMDNGIYKF